MNGFEWCLQTWPQEKRCPGVHAEQRHGPGRMPKTLPIWLTLGNHCGPKRDA